MADCLSKHSRRSCAGFTLLEILMAIGIFAAVVGTGYMVLTAGIKSYESGRETVDQYQNARAAVRQIEIDLRSAVSPAQSRWNAMPAPTPLPLEEDPIPAREEKEEEKIVFKGSSKDVRFAIQEFLPGRQPPWDLSEIRYFADTEKKRLMRENVRSIVEWNKVEWRTERMFHEDETNYRYEVKRGHEALLANTAVRQLVMAERIKDVAFRFSDGNEWKESWDSQEILNPPADPEENENGEIVNENQDGNLYKRGLPHLVEVTLTLSNDDKIRTVTEIPAWGKNAWYTERRQDRVRANPAVK